MMNNCLIISVESRKGGVGKTTAALNLARILLEKKKHAVLFLDVDITGTNAVDFLDSPFWKETCHGVHNAASKPSDSVNLLELFERSFMIGRSVPRFFNKKKAKEVQPDDNSLLLIPGKINIIGSQIYDLSGSPKKGSDKKNSSDLICRPSILFDELHAFWFIEFLQNLCKDFLETIRKDNSGRPVAVIIDNSPGYVGIAPAVQEWLTDLGPDKGKFLFVSSLDMQDLRSCFRGIHNLHQLYECKWKTSRTFINPIYKKRNSGTGLSLDPEEESFFLHLVEAHQRDVASCKSGEVDVSNCNINGIDLAFYRVCNDKSGKAYLNYLEKYQGLVINRVPRLVKRGVYVYKMHAPKDRKGTKLIKHLFGEKRESHSDFMVRYDESFEYQFFQPMISRRLGRISRIEKHLKEFEHIIVERYETLRDEDIQLMLSRESFDQHMIEEVRECLQKIHKAVYDVIHLAEEYGFSHLMLLIHEEWLPGNILWEFNKAMQDFFLEMGISVIEFKPLGSGKESINVEMQEFINELYEQIKKHTYHTKGFSVEDIKIQQILRSLIAVIVLSFNQKWLHTPIGKVIPTILEVIANIELTHFMQPSNRSQKQLIIQRFLAAERLEDSDWKDLRHKLRTLTSRPEDVNFSRVYRACVSAQARLINARQDAEFLIALIKRLSKEDISETTLLPYISGVAEAVIVHKTLSHESGQKVIVEGFYMKEFSEVLERIIERWECC